MSKRENVEISEEEIDKQKEIIQRIKHINDIEYQHLGKRKLSMISTFGCQMNKHDSEKISGMLREMGYEASDKQEECDLVIFNTCCVRENAELKVFGHLGAMKIHKINNPQLITAVCGCMVEQPKIVEAIKKKFKNVDLVFGTRNLHRFPELLYRAINEKPNIYEISKNDGEVAEGLPIERESNIKAWVTIMYGCDNFCSYCIVPYVRGRERSRKSDEIVKEIIGLVDQGIKEITLLGQNVNSYGKDLPQEMSFAELLQKICENTKIERLRFMTSHPKDLSDELIEVMVKYPAICKQIHLPVQSGSTDILREMNRKYTCDDYLNLVNKMRAAIPDITLSTDIIVGFPGEGDKHFVETLEMLQKARLDLAYTFIYSKRTGTPAAKMENQVPEDVIKDRFKRLQEVQNKICLEKNEDMVGKIVEVLVEGTSKSNENRYTGRTDGNKIVNFDSEIDFTGQIVPIKIKSAQTWYLHGEII